ncbi:hypothetical protein RAS1_12560 [Phycisphaerae bacterium RAS1]|nr:hypothetical protein RAS1_12560 [Phycisphaerae bacterium RAS1]
MTVAELASKLRTMYGDALHGEKKTMIHLFGIKYARQIRDSDLSCRDIAVAAGICESYVTEINNGVNLAKYVEIKPCRTR